MGSVRWDGLLSEADEERAAPPLPLALPGAVTRTFDTPGFAGMTFYEVHAKSIVNRVPAASRMPFEWTINPYRGCSHACTYCLSGDTPILMADGLSRPLAEIRPGDLIYGTTGDGTSELASDGQPRPPTDRDHRGARTGGQARRYTITRVLDHWRTLKPAYQVELADGTTLTASGDHRFLTPSGWKHVTGDGGRPHLVPGDQLVGTGHAPSPVDAAPPGTRPHAGPPSMDYRRGYLRGVLRDGLAFESEAALGRVRHYLDGFGVLSHDFLYQHPGRATLRTAAPIEHLVGWPEAPTEEWRLGFLAGVLDSAGDPAEATLAHPDRHAVELALKHLGFEFDTLDAGSPNRPAGTAHGKDNRNGALAIRLSAAPLAGLTVLAHAAADGMANALSAGSGISHGSGGGIGRGSRDGVAQGSDGGIAGGAGGVVSGSGGGVGRWRDGDDCNANRAGGRGGARRGRGDDGPGRVRLRGGLAAWHRLCQLTGPADRKVRSLLGQPVPVGPELRVVEVRPLELRLPLYDLTTETSDFVAAGVISHNCFARNTHTYLDLDAGHDFDSKVIVKVNAGRLLRKELSSARWPGAHIAMGTNVDCYQRAEGRYQLMREILAGLRDFANPFSILTKGTLILRDLDLLRQAAEVTDVKLNMSIGFVDERLWRSVEPGTPSPRRRLDAVRALTDAGFRVGVLVAPILPGITDDEESIDATMAALAAAGAASATPIPLHLRPGAREWYLAWLGQHRPDLVPRYRELFRGGSYSGKAYQGEVTARAREAARRHGIGSLGAGMAREIPPPEPSPKPEEPEVTQLRLL
jgi:DNA repair photolyase